MELAEDVKDCLECARAAICDAIALDDGLDGATGMAVVRWITDILQDYEEWYKTISEPMQKEGDNEG